MKKPKPKMIFKYCPDCGTMYAMNKLPANPWTMFNTCTAVVNLDTASESAGIVVEYCGNKLERVRFR